MGPRGVFSFRVMLKMPVLSIAFDAITRPNGSGKDRGDQVPTESVDRIGSNTVVHFDKSEVQEVGLEDPDYPQLLRAIRNQPKALRFRGSLPPNTKIIAISGSRETTQQALQTAYKIGKMLAEHGYTIGLR